MKVVDGIKEYVYKDVSFIITPKKLAVKTPLQFFIIQPSQPYYTRRLKTVILLIELGEVKSISDLTGYSQSKLDWFPSRREWL